MGYQTFGPDAEVYGAAMLAFVESANYTNFSSILEAHGMNKIDPNRWYPQQLWLDIFTDIQSSASGSSNLVSIGMKVVETAPIAPDARGMPFEEIMLRFNEWLYLPSNRGKDIGEVQTQIVDKNHILMIDKTPYPDDFVYGAYYAMARRFLPKDTDFVVEYDDTTARRSQGGDATLVHISWE